MKNIKAYIALFGIMFFLAGCSHAGVAPKATPPPCSGEKMKNFVLTWGDESRTEGMTTAYRLDYLGRLSFHVKEKGRKEKSEEIRVVEADSYCNIVTKTRNTLLAVQVLNEPGDKTRFVQYSDPGRNIDMRVVWNPEFKTSGSEKFRALYDSLQAIVEAAMRK